MVSSVIFGEKLRDYLIDKFGSLKKAARVLEISPPHLTMICKGIRPASKNLMKSLINIGFDDTNFDAFIKIKSLPPIDTEEDFRFIVGQMRRIIINQDSLITGNKLLIAGLQSHIVRLRARIRFLIKENHKNVKFP